MRNNLIESLMVGCGIALGVMLVHTWTQGAPATTQLLALLAAAIVLFCVQLGLAHRRSGRHSPPAEEPSWLEQHPMLSRRSRRNMFFRELADDWTGLDDHSAEREPAGPYTPQDLDDELWDDQPTPKREKAVARDQQQRKSD
jgi:hypothetical protein